MSGEFELKAHTADVAVGATGDTLDAVFGAVADGLAAAMLDTIPEGVGERFELTVRAESREALLFDYLDRLIYERDVRGVLPVDNTVKVTEGVGEREGRGGDRNGEKEEEGEEKEDGMVEWRAEASARGVPLEEVTAREVKAVTYSEMELRETAEGWVAYVVFDV